MIDVKCPECKREWKVENDTLMSLCSCGEMLELNDEN